MAAVRVVAVGDDGVGKTALLATYGTNEFPQEYVSTTLKIDTVRLTIDGKQLNLIVSDTGGQKSYDPFRLMAYKEADVCLICFAIDDSNSLKNVREKWQPEVLSFMPTRPIILIGCKSDLRNDEACKSRLQRHGLHFVTGLEGDSVAADMYTNYYETSAKTREGIQQCMEAAVIEVLSRRHIHSKEQMDKKTRSGLKSMFPGKKKKQTPPFQNPKVIIHPVPLPLQIPAIDVKWEIIASENTPREILKLGPEFIRMYRRACAAGSQKVSRVRVMLVGHFAAGKTSLRRYLLDEAFKSEYDVTNGIEGCKVSIENISSNWKIMKAEEVDEHPNEIAKLLNKALYHKQEDDATETLLRIHQPVQQEHPQQMVGEVSDSAEPHRTKEKKPQQQGKVPHPRLLRLRKWPGTQGYGFIIHENSTTGHYIGSVDSGYPAEAVNLQYDDIIIEINGRNVLRDTHRQVVRRLKEKEDEVELLVVDPAAKKYYKDRAIPIHGEMDNVKTIECPLVNPAVPHNVLEKLHDLRLVEEGATGEVPTQEENHVSLSMWDFAGQAAFLPTHQAFLTHRALYLMVFDMTRPLKVPIPTEGHGRNRLVIDRTLPQSVEEYFEYWMNSIHAHAVERTDGKRITPFVIFVGTHKDKVNKKMIDAYKTAVFEFIRKKTYVQNVYPYFFPVANNMANDPVLTKLRQTIMEVAKQQPYWAEKIPLQWTALSDQLRQLKQKDINVIGQNKVREIAEQVGITRIGDLPKILVFYHEMGDIVFFDEEDLREFIVLNPQWLIDAISRVITIDKFHDPAAFPNSHSHWIALEEHGILHDSLLDHVWDARHKKQLAKLMQKFRLMFPLELCHLAEVYEIQMQSGAGAAEMSYLVPCLLSPVDDLTLTAPQSSSTATSVFIVFRDNFLPLGVTSQLITTLVADRGWSLLGTVHHDYASFLPCFPHSRVKLTIHQRQSMLEVQGYLLLDQQPAESGVFEPYLSILMERIEAIINNTCPKASFQLAVPCTCGKMDNACLVKIGAVIEKIREKSSFTCHRHRSVFPSGMFSLWFASVAQGKDPATGYDEPLPKELVQKLQGQQRTLVEQLTPESLYDYLLEHGTLTNDEIEEIKLNAIRAEQVRRLLSKLSRKSCKDYQIFKDALLATRQEHVANLL